MREKERRLVELGCTQDCATPYVRLHSGEPDRTSERLLPASNPIYTGKYMYIQESICICICTLCIFAFALGVKKELTYIYIQESICISGRI